jgi:hypothetical protein
MRRIGECAAKIVLFESAMKFSTSLIVELTRARFDPVYLILLASPDAQRRIVREAAKG